MYSVTGVGGSRNAGIGEECGGFGAVATMLTSKHTATTQEISKVLDSWAAVQRGRSRGRRLTKIDWVWGVSRDRRIRTCGDVHVLC